MGNVQAKRAVRQTKISIENKTNEKFERRNFKNPNENYGGSGIWSVEYLPPETIVRRSKVQFECESNGFMTGVTEARVEYYDSEGRGIYFKTGNPYIGANQAIFGDLTNKTPYVIEVQTRGTDFYRVAYTIYDKKMKENIDRISQLSVPRYEMDFITPKGRSKKSLGKLTSNVVGGMIITFAENVSKQHRKDVCNSMSLAQLWATMNTNKEQETQTWDEKYRLIAESVGWCINNFEFFEYETQSNRIQIDKVVLEIFEGMIDRKSSNLLKTSMDSLSKLDDDDMAKQIWEHHSFGHFKIAFVEENMLGFVSMHMGYFTFKANQRLRNHLWLSWDPKDIKLKYAKQSLTLNEVMYEDVREIVVQKLRDNVGIFVGEPL